jgi:hypothetical protein
MFWLASSLLGRTYVYELSLAPFGTAEHPRYTRPVDERYSNTYQSL